MRLRDMVWGRRVRHGRREKQWHVSWQVFAVSISVMALAINGIFVMKQCWDKTVFKDTFYIFLGAIIASAVCFVLWIGSRLISVRMTLRRLPVILLPIKKSDTVSKVSLQAGSLPCSMPCTSRLMRMCLVVASEVECI